VSARVQARLAGALLALALAALAQAAGAAARGPSFVQVTEKEWSLVLSRQSVRSGAVVVELLNFGMDAHNLALLRKTPGAKAVRWPRLSHNGRAERTLRLQPGRYALWCTLPGHRARGMSAVLTVRK
jgi:hypothetical protein